MSASLFRHKQTCTTALYEKSNVRSDLPKCLIRRHAGGFDLKWIISFGTSRLCHYAKNVTFQINKKMNKISISL